MALPSSGQIAFSDVRTETSQSSMTNYCFEGWVLGANEFYVPGTNANISQSYAPINILSSGSRFSSAVTYSAPYEMSDWYSYNHTANISSSVTGTLYIHADPYDCNVVKSMLLVDVGTSNATWSINISGSLGNATYWRSYYGRPWNNVGGFYNTGSATYITGGVGNPNVSFNYNYTYDSSKGQYLYFVIIGVCP